jgi:hypothetical protein
MGIDSHLSTCVGTQSPKYLEMAQGHISLSILPSKNSNVVTPMVSSSGSAKKSKPLTKS